MDNAKDALGMKLAHIGINAADAQEAEAIADLFTAVFGLDKIETPISYFSDTYVEIMKNGGRGTYGHIGFAVDDINVAIKWFEGRGYKFIEDSRALNPDGSTKLIYFTQEFGGFAVHLIQA